MSPHAAVPPVEHYRYVAYEAAVLQKTLATLQAGDETPARAVLEAKLAEHLAALARCHTNVLNVLRVIGAD